MEKVVVRIACGLLLEDEQGQILSEPDLDTVRTAKITVVSPGRLVGISETVAAIRQVYDQLCAELARQVLELCGEGAGDTGPFDLGSPIGQAATCVIRILEQEGEN